MANSIIDYSIIINLYKQALKWLKCLHLLVICHLCITPNNLLVDDNATLKICHFETTRDKCNSGTSLRSVLNLRYTSLEILATHRFMDERVDMWSLALVFCILRYPKPLFSGKSGAEILGDMMNKFGAAFADSIFIPTCGIERLVEMYYPEPEMKEVILCSLKLNYFERKNADELLKMLN